MRALILAVSVVLAALAWLALDDLTTGREPDHVLEWVAVAAAAVWFGGLAAVGLRRGRVRRLARGR